MSSGGSPGEGGRSRRPRGTAWSGSRAASFEGALGALRQKSSVLKVCGPRVPQVEVLVRGTVCCWVQTQVSSRALIPSGRTVALDLLVLRGLLVARAVAAAPKWDQVSLRVLVLLVVLLLLLLLLLPVASRRKTPPRRDRVSLRVLVLAVVLLLLLLLLLVAVARARWTLPSPALAVSAVRSALPLVVLVSGSSHVARAWTSALSVSWGVLRSVGTCAGAPSGEGRDCSSVTGCCAALGALSATSVPCVSPEKGLALLVRWQVSEWEATVRRGRGRSRPRSRTADGVLGCLRSPFVCP